MARRQSGAFSADVLPVSCYFPSRITRPKARTVDESPVFRQTPTRPHAPQAAGLLSLEVVISKYLSLPLGTLGFSLPIDSEICLYLISMDSASQW